MQCVVSEQALPTSSIQWDGHVHAVILESTMSHWSRASNASLDSIAYARKRSHLDSSVAHGAGGLHGVYINSPARYLA